MNLTHLRQLIWNEAKGNQYTIMVAKSNIGYRSVDQSDQLLNEIRRLNKEAEIYQFTSGVAFKKPVGRTFR